MLYIALAIFNISVRLGRESAMKRKFALCLVLLCVLPGTSFAALVSFTTTTPITSTLTDWSGSLAFQKFNPALGNLTMVQIDLTGSMTTVLTVTNISSTLPSSGNAKTELQITVQDSGGNLNVPELDLLSPTFTFSNLGAGLSVTSGNLTRSGSSSDQYTAAAVLVEFTGLGTISLPASTFTQTLIGYTGGNTLASQATSAQLTGTVTYSYEVIPEPATMLLLGLGGLMLRKNRK